MSVKITVGKRYRLKANAVSTLGMAPQEILTYLGSTGGGRVKDDLMPIKHQFKRLDGSTWSWSSSIGELLIGWLEEAP